MTPKLEVSSWQLWGLVGLGVLSCAAYGVWLAAGYPGHVDLLFELGFYHAGILLAAGVCFARAYASKDLRRAWVSFGIGLVFWTAADAYYVLALQDLKRIPYPSLADVGYLAALPFLFAGIAFLVKHRVGHFTLASWIDGAVGAFAFAALGTALLAPTLIGLDHGDPATVFTNLAYPVGDIVLLAFIVGSLVVSGIRNSGALLLIGVGLVVWTGADMAYLYLTATDTYAGGWIDLLWPAGALLIGSGAALSTTAGTRPRTEYHSSLLVPLLATAVAITILIRDHFERLSTASIWLAGATLAAVGIRLLVSSRENQRLIRKLRSDSVTDLLTGLGNRRQLFEDLDGLLASRQPSQGPHHLALFDLDGFKAYNDGFGHSAGDALLRRLGTNLRLTIESLGAAYRLGGDEFCVLFDGNAGSHPSAAVEKTREALCESGDGFTIGASCGVVELGVEAETANEVIRVADRRMYREKGRRSRRANHRETHDVLLNVLREREPSLGHHLEGVAALAVRTAHELGLDAEDVECISRAAELHDIGKVAIPDAILRKLGPLDEQEWELMRQHTLIGERILFAAPVLRSVGALVRSSHERWDGEGYPDGRAAGEIPLGSRIIFVCDAFEAMTANRPYQRTRSADEAISELQRSAGTQFDPAVVEAFCRSMEQSDVQPDHPFAGLTGQGTTMTHHSPRP
jgi:diguanylate cyclase (GGDEF)-like protein